MKYDVVYSINGCIEVEANSKEEAMGLVGDIDEKELLEKSDFWMMNIDPGEVEVTEQR